MIDAGFILLVVIIFFAAIVLIRKHYAKWGRGSPVHKNPAARHVALARPPCTGTVEERLRDILADQMGIDVSDVSLDDTPIGLGADSLDWAEIAMECEDEFGVTMSEEEEQQLAERPLREIAQFLRELGAKDGEPEHLSSTGGH